MNILFKKIHIENFCNVTSLETDLGKKTTIKGVNRAGKSTIRNAILWLLTDKLSDNTSAGDAIRPHDMSGNRIDNVNISVSLTVLVDGAEYILTKIQKQKWVKKRGCEDREFQGNENLYGISGIPKKSKDFEQFISDNICPIDELPFCINANAFLSLDSKKRRTKVLSLAKSFTDAELAQSNEKFAEIANDFKVGTLDELIKRAKQTITALKKTQAELPARIDEASKGIVEYDFAELELEKSALTGQLASIDDLLTQKSNIEKQISDAKYELSAIENEENSSLIIEKNKAELAYSKAKNEMDMKEVSLKNAMGNKDDAMSIIESNKAEIEKAKKQMEIATQSVFDDSSLVCPTCGQNYPAEKEKSIRDRFESTKKDEMNRLCDYIESLENAIKSQVEKARAYDTEISSLKADYEKAKNAVLKAKEEYGSLPAKRDMSKSKKYSEKMSEIKALTDKLNNLPPIPSKAEIMSEIESTDRKLGQTAINERIEKRVSDLKEEQRIVGQNILKQEHILYLLEDFSRYKISKLEEDVNSYFNLIKWKFFSANINGGYTEVCKALVDGEDYDKLLNKSDKLLCQTDLVLGFQKAANVSLPVIIDDSESIDPDRIPALENQMIVLRRDDCKLTIEVG